jgi:hypothetical protein
VVEAGGSIKLSGGEKILTAAICWGLPQFSTSSSFKVDSGTLNFIEHLPLPPLGAGCQDPVP